jgi:hypothetical protein
MDETTRPLDEEELLYADADEPGMGEELPRWPRRRLLTPLTGGLLVALLVAGGFLAGVEVQKAQGDSAGGSGGGGAAAPAAAGQAAGQRGQAGGTQSAGVTIGTVASKRGSTLYVTGTDGTTVKVKLDDNAKITRTATATADDVHPGDTVIVQGQTAASGTVTATSVTATAKGVQAAGGFGRLGGFGAGRGGFGRGGSAGGPPGGAPTGPAGAGA